MASSKKSADLASHISKLSIEPDKKTKSGASKSSKSKKEVADSWEDEDVSSESESEDCQHSTTDAGPKVGTAAPPPTPVSPSYDTSQPFQPMPSSPGYSSGDSSSNERRRPEKTDAVARRMIASALGVKVPRQTDEQKAYDKAVREKERKRREEERAAEKKRLEEAERAKKAIWED
ncbi:uncharacterized protein E0L32_004826 [Thyridium curvatum]|uniref:Uncharacterized protein n=1 Tax=Thyridium curvatum TaxID=1093900 RepID=A0A507B786_9PEZI|nr:uncharacterized protein E0L32_004826 [Thyridium curvatum]TPX14996.1 hypothetical protein E0L32_004826 [Thyridium curvatum]